MWMFEMSTWLFDFLPLYLWNEDESIPTGPLKALNDFWVAGDSDLSTSTSDLSFGVSENVAGLLGARRDVPNWSRSLSVAYQSMLNHVNDPWTGVTAFWAILVPICATVKSLVINHTPVFAWSSGWSVQEVNTPPIALNPSWDNMTMTCSAHAMQSEPSLAPDNVCSVPHHGRHLIGLPTSESWCYFFGKPMEVLHLWLTKLFQAAWNVIKPNKFKDLRKSEVWT